MATFNVSGLSAVAKISDDIYRKAVLPMALVGEGFSIVEGVKGTQPLHLLDETIYLQTDACNLSTSGDTVFTDRTITVCPLAYYKEYCLKELNTYWQGQYLKSGSEYEDLDFMGATLLELISGKIGEINAKLFWQGSSSSSTLNLDKCNYSVTQILSGSTTRITTGTTAAVTSANIYAFVDQMINKVPDVIADKDLKLYMSYGTYRLWASKLATLNYYHDPSKENGNMRMYHPTYGNVELVGTPGLSSSSYMFLTYPENIVVGTDLTSELDQFEVFYDRTKKSVIGSGAWKIGAQIAHPEYVVVNF